MNHVLNARRYDERRPETALSSSFVRRARSLTWKHHVLSTFRATMLRHVATARLRLSLSAPRTSARSFHVLKTTLTSAFSSEPATAARTFSASRTGAK